MSYTVKNPSKSIAISTSALCLVTAMLAPTSAQAQAADPVVSVCSGVSLPPSVVTGIVGPVVEGAVDPLETAINGLLVPVPVSVDVAALLANAAAGDPITLQVLDSDGNVVGPADQCDAAADSFGLNTEGGISIGGNQITGLGQNGDPASAGEIDAIAFGNGASTAVGASGSIAIGSDAATGAANSVAIGANSTANRGALAGFTAVGLDAPQNSVGEFSVGAPGAERQITNVAAGTQPNDAATVGQVQGVADDVAELAGLAVQYDDPTQASVTLGGVGGTTIGNVADGAVAANSTEAVNGSQLFATNQNVAANTAAIDGLGGRVAATEGALADNSAAVAALDDRVAGNTTEIANLQDAVGAIGPQAVEFVTDADPSVPSAVRTNTVRLAGATNSPVTLGNVANAVRANDAVNLQQFQAGLDNTLAEARSYTDARIAALDFDLGNVQDDMAAGTAGALALAGMPQAYTDGAKLVGMGFGTYRGESAMAVGLSGTFNDGSGVLKVGASVDTRGYVGANGGVGFQF